MKKENKLKILIDLDSTIINTSKMIINLHNKLNPNNKIEYIKDCGWKFEPMIKTDEELSELFKLFDHKDFYNDVIYTKNAKEVIDKIAKEYEVVICSKHNDSRKPITKKFIDKEFHNCKLVFVDNFEDKAKIDCDFIIDDKIECLNGFNNKDTIRICFGKYQWNKEYNGIRYCDWKEIYNCIESINKARNDYRFRHYKLKEVFVNEVHNN